jgi:hypothetical protein
MNFNDHTVTWDTDTIPMKDRDTCTLSSVEALIEVYAEFKPASLDDVIKTCENLHVEEQHQLKELLQKYELTVSVCWNITRIQHGSNQSPTDGS